jgi:hypothetical protein
MTLKISQSMLYTVEYCVNFLIQVSVQMHTCACAKFHGGKAHVELLQYKCACTVEVKDNFTYRNYP